MITVIYTEEGEAINDFKIEEWFKSLKDGVTYEISSEMAITRLQVAIKEKEIDKNNIQFMYQNPRDSSSLPGTYYTLEHDRNGTFRDYPIGFLDRRTDLLLKLL